MEFVDNVTPSNPQDFYNNLFSNQGGRALKEKGDRSWQARNDWATMYYQNAYNTAMLNYMNQYNSPAEQMKRYQEAGISPLMVAAQADAGNMTSSHAGSAPKGSFTVPTSVQKQAAAVQTLQSINQVVGSAMDTYNYIKYGAPTASQQLANLQTQGDILGENFRKYAAEADWSQYWNYPEGYGGVNMSESPRAKYMAFSAQEKAAHVAQLESLVDTLYPSQAAANEARAALAVYQKEIQQGKYDAILQINTGYPALDNWLKLLAFKLVETNISF